MHKVVSPKLELSEKYVLNGNIHCERRKTIPTKIFNR